jgi:hypothetical protein
MIGESDQVTLQALIRRDGIAEMREAVARAYAEVLGWRVTHAEGLTWEIIAPDGETAAGTFLSYGEAWEAVLTRVGSWRERLPMPDSAYLVVVGTPVDGFGFNGPFAGRDAALEWAELYQRGFDGDWTIAPLAIPEAADRHLELGVLREVVTIADRMNTRQHAGLRIMGDDWSALFDASHRAKALLQEAEAVTRERESVVAAALRDLLGCCELNLDEMEDETRAAIERAREALGD